MQTGTCPRAGRRRRGLKYRTFVLFVEQKASADRAAGCRDVTPRGVRTSRCGPGVQGKTVRSVPRRRVSTRGRARDCPVPVAVRRGAGIPEPEGRRNRLRGGAAPGCPWRDPCGAPERNVARSGCRGVSGTASGSRSGAQHAARRRAGCCTRTGSGRRVGAVRVEWPSPLPKEPPPWPRPRRTRSP